jgi:hypothetical protein
VFFEDILLPDNSTGASYLVQLTGLRTNHLENLGRQINSYIHIE